MLISPRKNRVCVIGAGVVGCAVSRAFALAGFEVITIDPFEKSAQGISSRNSEVIHAGIYYPTNTLKAVLCVRGRQLLYEYCHQKSIPHKKIGKVIIAATSEEQSELEKIHRQAQANGVLSLSFLDQKELNLLEPHVSAYAALFSPETGVISAHDFCYSLETDAINHHASFVYKTLVTAIEKQNDHWMIHTQPVISQKEVATSRPKSISILNDLVQPPFSLSNESYSFDVDIVVNSAGLYSDWISALAGIDPTKYSYDLTWVKGEYFSLASSWSKKLSHLIYPVPEKNHRGLGVHVTIDVAGQAKLGPNTIEMNRIEDYSVNEDNRDLFFEGAKRYLPDLQKEDLSPGYSGIRPKLSKMGEPARDFIIQEESERNAQGFINLIGIESPGLTSALAIGEYILNKFDLR